MRITVNVYAYLRYYLPDPEDVLKNSEWLMPEGSTIGQVLKQLRLPGGIRVTVLVNNSSVDEKMILKEGDVVHILPQMAGGSDSGMKSKNATDSAERPPAATKFM
jgi:molybdopterin converting factor small subunit